MPGEVVSVTFLLRYTRSRAYIPAEFTILWRSNPVLLWNSQNLSDSVDNASLQELFSKFGDVLSCKVAKNEDGASRGYGFVQFASQESADAAIENLHGSLFNDRKLYVYVL